MIAPAEFNQPTYREVTDRELTARNRWPQSQRDRSDWDVEVFYDGACPLCRREIAMIRRRDHGARIIFTDISGKGFIASEVGRTMDQLMAEIHGRLPDGQWIVGPEVLRRLYEAIGFKRLVAASRLPGIRQAVQVAYRVFARVRPWLPSRKCEDDLCRSR